MCVFRKDKDMLEDKCKSNNLEREREQIDRIVKESGGKLTRRLVNSQVTGLFLCTAYCLVVCGLQFSDCLCTSNPYLLYSGSVQHPEKEILITYS